MESKSEAGVAGAVRHITNNLIMVILSNLDLLARVTPAETPAGRQVERSRLAAERLLGVLVPYTRLARDPGLERLKPDATLRALLPLLEVAGGNSGPITLTTAAVEALPLPRPALDLALLEWAQIAAAESPRGTALQIVLEHEPGGMVIRLMPNPGGAAGALVEVAALAGGSTRLTAEAAELRLPAA